MDQNAHQTKKQFKHCQKVIFIAVNFNHQNKKCIKYISSIEKFVSLIFFFIMNDIKRPTIILLKVKSTL